MSGYDKQYPPSYSQPPQAGYGGGNYGPQPQQQQPYAAGYSQGGGGTTVIVNQPRPGAPGGAPRMWTTGICGICEDVPICCCGTFCGLCLACQVATDMGESCFVPCCVPGADITLRVKWRTQENIQGSIMSDCLTAVCCGPCAMCQLAREVKGKKDGTLRC